MSTIGTAPVRHAGRVREDSLESGLVAGLLRPEAYPHPVERVELIETHISWVFLTGRYAYKMKKPVDLGFLDFRSLDRRRYFCEEEVRLNRQWAPELYLDVVPVALENGAPRIGGVPPVEYAVRMHQFDQAMRLDHLLEQDRLAARDMHDLAEEIAGRHESADRVIPASKLLLTTKRLIWENFDELIGQNSHYRTATLHHWTKESLLRHEELLKKRCADGSYRQCHGDLHLGNLVRLAGGIRAFDCIEFSEELRCIDIVADYGFLVMDLVARGRTDLAHVFLTRYLEIAGDYEGIALLPLYFVYRCLVRAKVAAIRRRGRRPGDRHTADSATLEHYMALAAAWVKRPRPVLVIMQGLSGSGKTWLSTELVAAMPAARIRSDVERKRLSMLAETADSGSGIGTGIYNPESGQVVYAHILDCARTMLVSGFDVILDAAFLGSEQRKQAKQLARTCGADFVIVRAMAPVAVLEERVRKRAAERSDASEAGLGVLQHQIETQEPLTDREEMTAVTVHTDRTPDIATLLGAIAYRRRNR
jgi:aminoglycoside phosphotransferase family enzyme/predicted kinase